MPDRSKRGASDPFASLWDVGPPPTPRDVMGWFQEAWPGKEKYPDRDKCAYVAVGVRAIRSVEDGRKRRKRNLQNEKAVSDVKTYAGAFMKHAPSVLRQLEAHLERLTLLVDEADGPKTLIMDENAYDFVSKTRDEVEQARDAVSVALDALKIWSAPYGKADRLRWVQRYMREAWQRTDGSCPDLTHENSPDVLFIKLALDSVGDHRKVESIARAFRPSRARQRTT